MTHLDLLRSTFIVDWTVLREGWRGVGPWPRLVTPDEIVAYALEVFSDPQADQSPGVETLAFADPQDWETLQRWLPDLASSDPEAIHAARRKWRVVMLQEEMATLINDALYGLLQFGDFWAALDYPEDSPHIVQGRFNTITPEEYYTLATFREMRARHERWLEAEIAALGGTRPD